MGFLKKVMNKGSSSPAASNRTNQQQTRAAAPAPTNNVGQIPQCVLDVLDIIPPGSHASVSVYEHRGVPVVSEVTIYGAQASDLQPSVGQSYPGNVGMPAATIATAATNAHNPAPPTAVASVVPRKYIKIDGVMRMNPEYIIWQERQAGAGGAAISLPNPDKSLPVVSSMEDHMQLNDDLGTNIPLSEATDATIEMMQDSEFCADAGMSPDTMVDELGAVLSKYEVPMGLMNKLMMLSEFHALEFIIDDSGSMLCNTDSNDPVTHKPISRWKEAQLRIKEMIEILAYVPFPQIVVEFLNRRDRVILARQGRAPALFIHDANSKIDAVFARGPAGTTPALEKLQESLINGQGRSIARYFFGDGIPNGGECAQKEIVNILMHRQNPEGNPITFISCTDETDQVEWMKDAEELIPFCSESDDFREEGLEVLRDQGVALPYTKGFHMICTLVAAMNPDDLDAMDESVPFTKNTLDNLLGIQHPEESYRYYFDCFVQAQRERKVEGPSDQLKKNVQWNYNDFLHAPMAKDIPQVQQIKQQLLMSSLPPTIVPSSPPSLVSPSDDMVTTRSAKQTDGNISSASPSPDDAAVATASKEYKDGQTSTSPSHGTQKWVDGGEYVGEYKDGKQHGHGIYKWADGSVFDGEWKDGIQNGQSTHKFADGSVYVGEYKDGKRYGHGTMKFAGGKVYFGEWIDDKINGHGTCKWADGGMYIGEWKDWKFHGQGTHKWANGGEFVGEFEDGNRHGQGSYKWANGCVYFGEWKDGKRHGQGTYKYPDGHEFSRDDILPSSEVVNPKRDLSENDQVCSICLDEFCRREERVVLPCSHGFHTCCANRWLSSESTCPVCRTPVPQESVSVTLTPFQMHMLIHALVSNELNSDSD